MTTAEQVRDEERRAAEQHRNLARARKIAERQRESAWKRKLREVARERKARYPRCQCSFTGIMTKEELVKMPGCCDPRFVCPRLDSIRREML